VVLPVLKAAWALLAYKVHKVQLEPLALLDKRVLLALSVKPALLVKRVLQEQLEPLDRPEQLVFKALAELQVLSALLALLDSLAVQELQV